jgi:uronate dehydrogenase
VTSAGADADGTVLLTGAAGRIGTMLRERLPALGWGLRGFDRTPVDDGDPLPMVVGDLTDSAALDAACAGVAAVVHLAGQPTEAPWPVIREANIEGTFQLFEAARRAGVARVVYASSNHAVGFTPRPPAGELAADVAPRPDTLYGVSKVFGEALGRYYVDRYGLAVACLRIGNCAPEPSPESAADARVWLSPNDVAGLVDACLHAPDLRFAILWGVSANAGRWWSLREAEALGFRATDGADAEPAGPAQPGDDMVGRAFTTPAYGIEEIGAPRS